MPIKKRFAPAKSPLQKTMEAHWNSRGLFGNLAINALEVHDNKIRRVEETELIAIAIENHWGERCTKEDKAKEDHDSDCYVCGAWTAYDKLIIDADRNVAARLVRKRSRGR